MSSLPDAWTGLVDDAAIFPPGNAALPDAVQDHQARRDAWYAELVGPLVVTDTKLPDVPADIPVTVVRHTRAGDAWEARMSGVSADGVLLGLPSIGVPAPLPCPAGGRDRA